MLLAVPVHHFIGRWWFAPPAPARHGRDSTQLADRLADSWATGMAPSVILIEIHMASDLVGDTGDRTSITGVSEEQLFGQYAAAWLAGPDLGERTRDDYAQILRDRINPALGPRS